MMTLKDKVVLVTGASSGIGQATAVRFAKEGAKVVVNYKDNKQGAEETLAAITKTSEGIVVQADVSKPDDVQRLFESAVAQYGTVDILINNAAIPNDKVEFMKTTFDDMREIVDNNLLSVMMCSQVAAKIMLKQGHGKILNTSSIRGWQFGGRLPVYAASKAGVNNFTSTLAKELAPNIHVNAVAPGYVRTRVYDSKSEAELAAYPEQTKLKRFIEPEEIADAFVFLAQNDAITGQVIYVDAGLMLK
jgi:3-oxoacyl-[acyl-carrier protein] reductase